MSIGYPAIRNANAAINVGQATNPTNICGANQNPVFCQNTGGNLVVVNPAPDVNQAIDVTGNQLITPTNQCDDDNGHTCINNGAGNAFVLTHDTFADVQVDSFEQDTTQDNTCFFFQECTNLATNVLVINAEDATGATATNDDVTIGSSVQTIGQTNDCDGVLYQIPCVTTLKVMPSLLVR